MTTNSMGVTFTFSNPGDMAAFMTAIAQNYTGTATVQEPQKPAAPKKDKPAPAAAAPMPTVDTAGSGTVLSEDKPAIAGKITVELLRETVQKKTQGNDKNREAIKAILKEFDSPNVSSLKAEHYADFLQKVNAL